MKVFGDKDPKQNYHERPGAYGIILNNQIEIAIIKLPGGYFLPGGGCDQGESAEATLKREVLEETGCKISIKKFIGKSGQYYFSRYRQRYVFKTGQFFECQINPATCDPAKDHELVWMTTDLAVKNLNHSFQKWAVKEALSGI